PLALGSLGLPQPRGAQGVRGPVSRGSDPDLLRGAARRNRDLGAPRLRADRGRDSAGARDGRSPPLRETAKRGPRPAPLHPPRQPRGLAGQPQPRRAGGDARRDGTDAGGVRLRRQGARRSWLSQGGMGVPSYGHSPKRAKRARPVEGTPIPPP